MSAPAGPAMLLDPDMARIAEAIAARPKMDIATLDPAVVRSATENARWPTRRTEMHAVEDIDIRMSSVSILGRIYRPRSGVLPLMAFFHGGGFVICSIDTHDNFCRALAKACDCAVVSVGYRLAPEHRFPAPFEDCVGALDFLADNAGALGCDPGRLAAAGDSAGGNLAAAAVAHAGKAARSALRHLLLFYPAVDPGCAGESYESHAETPMLNGSMMRWFWRQYLRSDADRSDPRVALLKADRLARFPATTILAAQYDPLSSEIEAFAAALARHSVDVELTTYPGVSHGFASMVGLVAKADDAIEHAATRLRLALAESKARVA